MLKVENISKNSLVMIFTLSRMLAWRLKREKLSV